MNPTDTSLLASSVPSGSLRQGVLGIATLLLLAPFATAAPTWDQGAEAPLPLQTSASTPFLGEIINLVASSDTNSEGRGMALAFIVSKGPRAVPAVTALLSQSAAIPDELEEQGPFLTPAREALLLEALQVWDSTRVAEQLQAELEARPSLALRTLAIDLLGKTGNSRCLEAFLDFVAGLKSEELEHPSLRKPAVQAMARILRRDALSYVTLSVVIGDLSPELTHFAVDGIGTAGKAEGVDLLERLLGRSPSLDQRILTTFTKLEMADQARVAPQVRRIARPFLHATDPSSRCAAIEVLGHLKDHESIVELVGFLSDNHSAVSASALDALRRLSGTRWPATPARWMHWYERERRWIQGPAKTLTSQLRRGSPELAAKAVRELSQHPLFGDRIIEALHEGSQHSSRQVAVLSCEALGRLRNPEALGALVDALFDPRSVVREAAANGLRDATGQDLPIDGATWRDWLEG